jgi:hypothetical protein
MRVPDIIVVLTIIVFSHFHIVATINDSMFQGLRKWGEDLSVVS